MRRFDKSYNLINSNGTVVGQYTTVDGAHRAATRMGLTGYSVEPIKK